MGTEGIVNFDIFALMYSALRLSQKYAHYYLTAANGKGHGVHSPFVFDFITRVLNDKTPYPEYKKVESLRRRLKKDATQLQLEDMGAGSASNAGSRRSVSSIARHAVKPKKYAQLLFRMARYYQPEEILELGTSLGLTTAYFSLAAPGGRVITLEGAAAVAACAKRNFEELGLTNITLLPGNFDDTLQPAVEQFSSPGLIFIDGNHRKEPTIRYFEQLLKSVHNNSILIFDDIHWSREMEDAWGQIRRHPAVQCTIDLFFIGIVFINPNFKIPQHFTIRF